MPSIVGCMHWQRSTESPGDVAILRLPSILEISRITPSIQKTIEGLVDVRTGTRQVKRVRPVLHPSPRVNIALLHRLQPILCPLLLLLPRRTLTIHISTVLSRPHRCSARSLRRAAPDPAPAPPPIVRSVQMRSSRSFVAPRNRGFSGKTGTRRRGREREGGGFGRIAAEARENGGEVRSVGGRAGGGEEVGEPGRGGLSGRVEDEEEGAGDEGED